MTGESAPDEPHRGESRPEPEAAAPGRARAEPPAAEQAVANERAALESGEENTS